MMLRTPLGTLLATLLLAVALPEQDGKDPFAASDTLRRGAAAKTGAALPTLALKGYIEDDSGNAMALLEVEGKRVYLVRKEDVLTLSHRAGDVSLKITELNRREMRIEIAGRKVVIR